MPEVENASSLNQTETEAVDQVDQSDLYDDWGDTSRKLAALLHVTVTTSDLRLRRALERQAKYQEQTVEQYVAQAIAHIVVSDEGQSTLNDDGTVDLTYD
jgi:hypothetical protein